MSFVSAGDRAVIPWKTSSVLSEALHHRSRTFSFSHLFTTMWHACLSWREAHWAAMKVIVVAMRFCLHLSLFLSWDIFSREIFILSTSNFKNTAWGCFFIISDAYFKCFTACGMEIRLIFSELWATRGSQGRKVQWEENFWFSKYDFYRNVHKRRKYQIFAQVGVKRIEVENQQAFHCLHSASSAFALAWTLSMDIWNFWQKFTSNKKVKYGEKAPNITQTGRAEDNDDLKNFSAQIHVVSRGWASFLSAFEFRNVSNVSTSSTKQNSSSRRNRQLEQQPKNVLRACFSETTAAVGMIGRKKSRKKWEKSVAYSTTRGERGSWTCQLNDNVNVRAMSEEGRI